ncbi:phosphotransferase [Leptolinea sp. HRD-7]|nr:phosphotransferase [Leptolinea sp. HRD-7]
MSEEKFIVAHSAGLHARPAALFVKTCNSFPCDIKVQNLTTGSIVVNAKSVLSVLILGVDQGHEILVTADGDKEKDALAAIKKLIESNFGEKL